MIALLAASALAQGIVQVPEGSVLEVPGKPRFTVPEFSFLLPESHYNQALAKALQLQVCEPALARCTETSLAWVASSEKALAACSEQFKVDASTIDTLKTQVSLVEARALTAEERLRTAHQQRNVAWAITGGLLLGGSVVVAVAVGG